MRSRAPFIAVLICAAAPGCGSGDSSDSPTTPSPAVRVQIAGRVLDERSGQGMPGVTLLWGGRTVLSQVTAVTDATGSYQVQLPEAEFYSVSGSNVFPLSVVRPTSSLDIINFFVNTGGCPTQYGRIVDATTRRPVPGAQVSWVGVTSTTDAAGSYRLTLACQPGAYGSGETTLSVSHSSYQPYTARAPNGDTLGVTPADLRQDIALTPR